MRNIEKYIELPDRVEKEELYGYFDELICFVPKDDEELQLAFDILCELADRQWHSYEQMDIVLRDRLELWILEYWDQNSLELTESVTGIIGHLGLEKVYDVVKSLLYSNTIPDVVRAEIIDTVLEFGEYVSNPYEDMEKLSKKKEENMKWPNNAEWSALTERLIGLDGQKYLLSKVLCGMLKLPSGKLVCCDPFAAMSKTENSFVQVPTGEFEAIVTLADVSLELDRSHYREAYASIIFDESKKEVSRKILELTVDGKPGGEQLQDGEYYGFGVDAGTACFVDAESLIEGMPDEDTWFDELFDCAGEKCWFELMDDPNYIHDGIANIELPLTKEKNNLVLFHSGWGDGIYPVIGGYDTSGNLIAVHIDFFVIPDPSLEEEELINDKDCNKPWWKFW